MLFAAILRLNRARHFGPHIAGHAVVHRNFADLLDFTAQFQFFHSPAFFQQLTIFHQPLPLAVVYKLFLLAGSHAVAAFTAALLLVVITAAALFARRLVFNGTPTALAIFIAAAALLFAWPAWFCLKQGNFEFALFALCAVGLCAFIHRRPYAAASCFALAGSMKLYPLLYLGLLLSRRQYRAFFFGLLVFSASILASLWLVSGDILLSLRGMLTGLGAFRSSYVLAYQTAESGLDHSLFGLVKLALALGGRHDLLQSPAVMGHLTVAYMCVVVPVGILLWFFQIRHLPLANQVLALAVAAILLPPLSFEYTLLHLYLPFALLVPIALQSREAPRPGLTAVFILLAILVSPLMELFVHGWGLAGELKAVLLLSLFTLALTRPFPEIAAPTGNSQSPQQS